MPSTALAVSPQYGVDDQTDVFVVDNDGGLWVAWVSGAGQWNGPVRLGDPNVRLAARAPLAASAQYGVDGQTDVFAVDANGRLSVAWVSGAGQWNGPVAIGDPNVIFPPGAPVAASPQYGVDGQTDVFVVDNDGGLWVAWVSGAGQWNGPVKLAPPPGITIALLRDDGGNFAKVDGFRFTLGAQVSVDYEVDDTESGHTFGTEMTTADGSGAFSARIDINVPDVHRVAVKATDGASHRSATAQVEAPA